jgi:hypothetical protein
MSSVVSIYFVDSKIVDIVIEKFSNSLGKRPVEIEPLKLMRMWYHGHIERPPDFIVVRRIDILFNRRYGEEDIISLVRKALRSIGSSGYLIVEVSSLKWSSANPYKIEINEIEFPVSSIRVDDTYDIADKLNLDRGKIVKVYI